MRPFFIYTIFIFSAYTLISNAGGVPQAVTKSPAEANTNSCATCHTPSGNYVPAIALDVMKSDATLVTSYNPGETYDVRIRVTATNNPKSFGFQLSCIDSIAKKDLGNWSVLGDKVKLQNLKVLSVDRKYLVQSAPKTSGIFTAKWTAPTSNVGTIQFHFAGLAVNATGTTSGDNNVFGSLKLKAPAASFSDDQFTILKPIYPNPAQDIIRFANENVHTITLTSLTGNVFHSVISENHEASIFSMPKGVYHVTMFDKKGVKIGSQRLVKL